MIIHKVDAKIEEEKLEMQRKKRRQSMQVDFHKLNLSGIVQSKTTLRSTVSLIENQDFNTVENEEIKMTKKQTFHVY